MAEITRFKTLTTDDTFKGPDKSFSTQKSAYGRITDGGDESLKWYMVERTDESWSDSDSNGDLKNLFMSFGLAREDENDWLKMFDIFDWHNAKRMIIASIPQSGCSSYIDGSTVQLRVPTGSDASDYVTFYGSCYAGYPDPETGLDITVDQTSFVPGGGAACYLFPEYTDLTANARPAWGTLPYTGNVDGGAHPNAGSSNWTDANLNSETFYPHLRATNWKRGDDGRDVPYGMAFLEKGIFVIFDSFQRDADFIAEYSELFSGVTVWNLDISTTFNAYKTEAAKNTDEDNRSNIMFAGTNGVQNARLTYRTVERSYKMIYFCHAGQGEFNSTSNHTYNHNKGYFRPEEADSLWVTEIGLYDNADNLLAYAKLSEPVEKNRLETLTFKVELQL